jgi:hypothetical protein
MKILQLIGSLLIVFQPINLLAQQFQKHDILINEVLFNPPAGGVDFIEIYNATNRTINLSEVFIANVNNKNELGSIRKISTSSRWFYPNSLAVITSDVQKIIQHYPHAAGAEFIQLNPLPSYPNKEGHVVILANWHQHLDGFRYVLLDSLHYHEDMHDPFFRELKGVSLERKSNHLPTNSTGNFTSAAWGAGGATPGFRNSNQLNDLDNLELLTKIVSPDGDGIADEMTVKYTFKESNLMATAQIFNSKGKLTHTIVRNTSIASTGTWTWNGKYGNGTTAVPDLYTLVIEIYNADGLIKIYRKTFVLTMRK